MSFSLFWQVVRLSLTAGWMILVLLALRPLLKKAPRRFSCLLWGLVAVRLALPFSFESRVSMVPQAAAAPQKIAQALNPGQMNWVSPAALAANPLPAAQAAAPAFSPATLIPLVWGLGIAAMLLYAAVSYFRLSRQVRLSAPAGKRVYRCDTISTPFILGIVNPKIFLPSDLDERTAVSVLAHEQAHLRRGDHLWKPLGYVLLSIYWFNPLCWVAYFLFCRDVEQACDEAVIERMDTQQKKDYSAALLACAAPNRIQVCPLAFAEVGVKQRIAGVLNYRKPKFWVVALAALLCVSLTAGLLTDPVKATRAEDNTQQTLPTGTEISTTVGVPLNVRSEPTLNAPAIAFLETGTQIQILRTQSVDGIIWAYVSADTLTENGWVMAIYLNTVEGEALPTVSADVTHGSPSNTSGNTVTVTTKGAVDLYASPTVKSRVVFQLEDGSPVTILRIDSIGQQSWAYVQSVDLDRPGWILVDSLNTESIDLSIYDAAPVATPTVPLPAQLSSSILTEEIPATTKGTVDLYASPTVQGRVVFQLEDGSPVTILRIDSIGQLSWAYVQSVDLDRPGWIPLDSLDTSNVDLSIYTTPVTYPTMQSDGINITEETSATTKEALTLYTSPSLNARTKGELAQGESVTIIRIDSIGQSVWTYIRSDTLNATGWVLADSFDIDGDTLSIPSAKDMELMRVFAEKERDSNSYHDHIDKLDEIIADYTSKNGTSQVLTEGTPAIAKENLNVRQAPSVQSKAVGLLLKGEQVTVLRTDLIADVSWSYVQYGTEERTGWVLSEYLDTGDTAPIAAVAENPAPLQVPANPPIEGNPTAIAREKLNVRQDPTAQSKTVGSLAQGEQVMVIRTDLIADVSWSYVQYGTEERKGWVLSEYLDTGDTAPIAAVAENPAPQQVPSNPPMEGNPPAIAKENLNVRQAPSVQSKAVGLLLKGEQVTVLRTDLFENVSWSYVQYGTEKRVGWVISEYLTADDSIAQDGPLSLTAALEYFQRYIQAIALDTPDKAEGFLYFATEYSREFFRDNYAPVTGWDITAISQLADDLCCIAWSSPSSTDYAFVGQMNGRLYVFRTVHELPEHWKAGLDVAQYEQENAMYMTEALLECYAVTKRLMDFAQPVQVKITQKDGWKPAETPWELDFADAVCGTDTWHFTQEISDKTPQCTILLTAEDGSTARIWDVDGTVLITHPDGTQEICIADFQGEATYEGSSLLSTVYQWATNLA